MPFTMTSRPLQALAMAAAAAATFALGTLLDAGFAPDNGTAWATVARGPGASEPLRIEVVAHRRQDFATLERIAKLPSCAC